MTLPEEASLRLRRLLRDVNADCMAMAERAGELKVTSVAADDPAQNARLAIALHHYYTALESAVERLLRFTDGSVASGVGWHQALLLEASREIPGTRPPILAAAQMSDLSDLLRFRHFFRHAYSVTLDRNRLNELARKVERIHPAVLSALERFTASLEKASDALRGPGRQDPS